MPWTAAVVDVLRSEARRLACCKARADWDADESARVAFADARPRAARSNGADEERRDILMREKVGWETTEETSERGRF